MGEGLFSEFVRQSLLLDLSDLVGVPKLYVRSASEKSHEDAESTVEYREKAEVLAELETFVDQGSEDEIEALEYDEDAAWAEAVRGWMKQQGLESTVIAQLQQGTGLTLVKLWLAGLLGGLGLEQRGGGV